MRIKGVIVDGLGKAASIIPRYYDVFNRLFGFIPFPGTINLKVERDVIEWFKRHAFYYKPPDDRGGFFYKKGTFLNNECIFIVADRTQHKDILEIILPCKIEFDYEEVEVEI